MMLDILSLLHTILRSWGIAHWIVVAVLVIVICGYLLLREYGKTFIAHLLHRRNLPALCGMLLFGCVYGVLFQTGLFMRLPFALRIWLIILYAAYVAVVLRSVQTPTLWAGSYLKKYQNWLKAGKAGEHREFLAGPPWYFRDKNEILGYEILKGKYLFSLGNLREAYAVMDRVDQADLYPEEKAELTLDCVQILIALGNFPKAESRVAAMEKVKPTAYFFLRSYLAELQGDLDAAWQNARKGEDAIDTKRKDAHLLCELYTQLGRLSFFHNNCTEGFRYYRLALDNAKRYGDIHLFHPTYQNLINQMQIQHLHEDEMESLQAEYREAVADSSLENMTEWMNFCVGLARQQGDLQAEFETILTGYRKLHQKATPPEQYMIEVSTLAMLTNYDFDADVVLQDIADHFDQYFSLPLPARFIVLQGLTCPRRLTAVQEAWYAAWTPRLVTYGREQAEKDLDTYEADLSTDCVNERCWVIGQRIDFLRRSNPQYDGKQVLQWLNECLQIYRDCGQVYHEIETQVMLVKQYEEMVTLGQLQANEETAEQMRRIVAEAMQKAHQLPVMTVGAMFIDLAYYSAKLGEKKQAADALHCFQAAKIAPRHLPLVLREKLSTVEALLGLTGR